MNPYEAKQQARRERLEAAAERARRIAQARSDAAHRSIEHIPPGQPILIGHHSERHHRADLARHDRHMRASIDADQRARELAGRAAAIGQAGISSDDPEAIDKLRAKLATLEALQARMTAANKLVRKHKANPADAIPHLVELGMSEAVAKQLFEPDFCGRIGFPAYATSNNNANIRRIKERIAHLERDAKRETKQTSHPSGVTIVENADANRLQLFFPGKPAEDVRKQLKSYGFRWSPTEGAWQRQLSTQSLWAATHILDQLPPASPTASI